MAASSGANTAGGDPLTSGAMVQVQLMTGIVIGALVSVAGWTVFNAWLRRRQTRRMIDDLSGLELPFLMVEFPSRRIHFSGALRERLGPAAEGTRRVDEVIEAVAAVPDRPRLLQMVEEIRTGANVYRDLELSLRFVDGSWHQVEIQLFRLATCGRGAGVLAATVVDRTLAHEVEEERDRLFNLSLDLLAVSDLDGRLLQVNPAWVRVLRWSRDDIMARTFVELIHPDDRDRAHQAQDELRQGMPVRELELRTVCLDGSHRWISWSSFPLIARGTVFTVARDINDRKAAEEELQRYQHRLRQLASQLATVEERSNRRLAEILHDTLAQDLFAASAKLSLLNYPDRLADPSAVLREVADILAHATELTRTLTFELFPPALYEVGLDAALEWLCRSFRKTRGLDCGFELEGVPVDLAQDLRALLYQGARELLGNIYKHADAGRAEVLLRYDGGQITLQVDDDGAGFDLADSGAEEASESVPSGFGLFNIRERLGQLDGQLSIETSPLGGGRVIICLPTPLDPAP
jgi:PAS domain S-box-containing protein